MQCLVPSSLHYFDLDEEALFQPLWASLHRHTGSFAHQLIDTITHRLCGEAQHQMGLEVSSTARGWEDNPSTVPGSGATQGSGCSQAFMGSQQQVPFCPHSHSWRARKGLGAPRGRAWVLLMQLANKSPSGAPLQVQKGSASSSEDPSQAPRETAHHPVTGQECSRT